MSLLSTVSSISFLLVLCFLETYPMCCNIPVLSFTRSILAPSLLAMPFVALLHMLLLSLIVFFPSLDWNIPTSCAPFPSI